MKFNDIQFDELGPQKIIHIYSPKTGLKAIVVIDNTALGPSIGGVRVSPSVTTEEVARLARTMTLKNSIAGLPHGGGKAGIIADHNDPKKELYFRDFAIQIKALLEYIPGPDMGSDEQAMGWIFEEIKRAVGLPEKMGGLPLDKLGATGFGVAECAEISCPFARIELNGSRVAIQGFGSVGKAAARFLAKKGAIIVAASDTKGTIHNPNGLDVNALIETKDTTGSVINHKKGIVKKPEEIFSIDCEILIPAATPDVIHKDNVQGIKAKMVLQGANIPATKEAEEILHKRGIIAVPDFIANAGGVIMAAMEYAKKTEKEAFEAISQRIKTNTKLILEKSKKENRLPRQVAEEIAKERVLKAMQNSE
ncbi:MAG: Glu/Leu/Phe/Val dehydrogenase [Thermodesulfovibrionales bacterium]|nr:Glu/Leu/Phe/Val dehydrogenase [Thermodesulfovibrionales bacterium]